MARAMSMQWNWGRWTTSSSHRPLAPQVGGRKQRCRWAQRALQLAAARACVTAAGAANAAPCCLLAFTPACLCQTAGCCTRLAGIQINDADEFLPTLEKALEMQASSSWMDVRGWLEQLGRG